MSKSGELDFGAVIEQSIETLTHFSIPLYRDEGGRPLHSGTGFFVNVERDAYFVTAAHVLDLADEVGLYFYTSPNEIRHLTGRRIRSKYSSSREDDLIDIGIVKMSGSGLPPYPEIEKYPMDLSYLRPNYRPRGGKNYVIVGFPHSKNRFDVVKNAVNALPYAYRSDSVSEEDYPKYGADPAKHIVLPLDQKAGFDSSGRSVNFPKPEGMSGSPVTVLYSDDDDDSRVFPVVGVGIEYRAKQKVLVATDVAYVADAIRYAA